MVSLFNRAELTVGADGLALKYATSAFPWLTETTPYQDNDATLCSKQEAMLDAKNVLSEIN